MAFAPGAVLGGRFELHGVVGRGGTAEVWLATDRLRGERVALKLVHPHLAADPDTRRRLRREVQAASVLRSAAALGPHDLHELDGVWALSMPFHPGQTLTERVAANGPMTPAEVRALGIRVATALADAHRAGVLHRDVTANNVLVGDRVEDSVLTDFGLSRVLGGGRSTGLLGTAGYAAPEVYAGNRADPRSDLYGLGAVLYLALTGKPAFDPRDPMGALKAQLEDRPVRIPASSGPPDLIALIESLLRPDPALRPQGATEVLDALQGVAAPVRPRPRAPVVVVRRGRFTVVVKERSDQRQRRDELRRRALGAAPTAEDQILSLGRQLWGRVREAIGVPGGPALTPEQALHAAVADVMQVAPEALPESPVVLERKFRLVSDVDESVAVALVERASALGFHAQLVDTDPRAQWIATAWIALMVAGWVGLPIGLEYLGFFALPLMIAFTVFGAQATEGIRGARGGARRLPVAYAPPTASTTVAEAPPQSRGQGLAERARDAIAALEQAAAEADLPDLALSDLRASTRAMTERADRLARDIDAAEAALAPAATVDVAALNTRLERMAALERAGESVDARERSRIERALAEHAAAEEAGERLESELASATAAVVEITSAAVRLRRELTVGPDRGSADEAVRKLSREAGAAIDARREAARRARAAER